MTCFTAGAIIALAGLAPPARAAQQPAQAKGDPAKEFAAIQKSWAEAQNALRTAYQEAKTAEEKQKILREKRPQPAEYADRFLKLAETYPDSPEAGQALTWVVTFGRGTEAAKKAADRMKQKLAAAKDLDELHKVVTALPSFGFGDVAPAVAERARKDLDHPKALPLLVWVCSSTLYGPGKDLAKVYNDTVDLLVERFPERKELAPLPGWLAQDEDPAWAEKHLRTLLKKNPDADVKTNSRLALAGVLKNKDEASQPEAEKLYAAIVEELGKRPDKKAELDKVKKEFDDMRVRGIGKPVPDINGDDLDGKAFKLSDYKGKVVLLDFWGFW